MNKNPLFIFVLAICVISLLIGFVNISPVKNAKVNENNSKFDKLISQSSNKVAIIELNGVISSTASSNFFEEDSPSNAALKAINRAEKDDSVKGVILKINSPGGTVGMSQKIYNAVLNLRKTKPVIALMDDVAASGGYYVASACDRIVSLPGTMTGSIGVIMSTMDFHKLLTEKLAVNENVIKSGKYKDMGSSTRAMTKEERELLQEMINDSYSQFIEAITKGRVERNDEYDAEKVVLTAETLKKYADGRIFTGRQALKYGFVDSNGGIASAQDMMQKMVAKKYKISSKTQLDYDENYTKTVNFFKLFGVNSNAKTLNEFIPQSMQYAGKPLYLWE